MRVFLDSKFYSFSLSQLRYRSYIACVCEVQLCLCVEVCLALSNWASLRVGFERYVFFVEISARRTRCSINNMLKVPFRKRNLEKHS